MTWECNRLFEFGVLFCNDCHGCISTCLSNFNVVNPTIRQGLLSVCCWTGTTKELLSLCFFCSISVTEVLVTTLVPKRRKRSRKRRRKLVPQKQSRTLLLRFSFNKLCMASLLNVCWKVQLSLSFFFLRICFIPHLIAAESWKWPYQVEGLSLAHSLFSSVPF